jgi:hypothetical protein
MNINNKINSENIRVITTVVGIFLVLFASLAAPKLPRKYTVYLENNYVRIGIFLLIAYLATIDIPTAIIAVVAVLVSYQTLSQQITTEVILNETNHLLNKIPYFNTHPVNTHSVNTHSVNTPNIDNINTFLPNASQPSDDIKHNNSVADYSLNPLSFIDNLSINNLIEPEGSDNAPIYASSEAPIDDTLYTSTEPVYTSTEPVYTSNVAPVYTSTEPVYASVEAPTTIMNSSKEYHTVVNDIPDGVIEDRWHYDDMDVNNVALNVNVNVYGKSSNEYIDNTFNGFDEADNEYGEI